MHPKRQDLQRPEEGPSLSLGVQSQMDATHHTLEKPPGPLGERVKEHSKSTTSAILKHCKDFHHPLPSIDDFNIINKEPSQVTREAKEAIHIRQLDPSLNRNIGKMSIPQCFDNLLGAKPKHPRVGELSAAPPPCRRSCSTASNTRPKPCPI